MMAMTGIEMGIGIGMMLIFVGLGLWRLAKVVREGWTAERHLEEIREGKTDSEQISRAIGWSIVFEIAKKIVLMVAKQALIVILERILDALKTSGKDLKDVTENDIREVLCETRGELWKGRVVEDLGEEGDRTAVKVVLESIGLVKSYGHAGSQRLVQEADKPGWAREELTKVRRRVFGKPVLWKGENRIVKPEAKTEGKPVKGNVQSVKPMEKKPAAKKPVEKVDAQFYGDGEDW